MKRIIMMVIRNIFIIPALWIKLCYHASHVDKYTKEEHDVVMKEIVYRANKGGNVKIITSGSENIPKEDGFIFYPNHQGLYDVLAIVDVCPRPFGVVAKKEVKNVPLLKQVFLCTKSLMIDREDVRQSMQVIVEVTKQVSEGRNFLIFAEGTRSKKGNQTIDFKGGSFKAAVKAKCPIVPIALIDSFKPFDTNTIKKVEVQVHFLKPILFEEYKDMNTNEIALEVKRRIDVTIKEKENRV